MAFDVVTADEFDVSPFGVKSMSSTQLLTSIDPDAEKYLGLPISLQLVGRRCEDEKVRWP